MDQMKGLSEHRKYLLCRLLASEAFSTCHLDVLQLVLIIFVLIFIVIFVVVILEKLIIIDIIIFVFVFV